MTKVVNNVEEALGGPRGTCMCFGLNRLNSLNFLDQTE